MHKGTPSRPTRRPWIFTAAPNERAPNERANPLTRAAAAVPYDATDTATRAHVGAAPPRRRERRGGNNNGGNGIGDDGGDGGIDGLATAANRERKHVSAFACAPMASNKPRCAHVGGCGRAYLGARRRSRRSRRSSEPGSEAGTQPEGRQSHALESAHPQGLSSSAHLPQLRRRSQSRHLRAKVCT